MPAPVDGAGLPDRDRIVIWGCLVALIALAWGYLFFLDRQMASMLADDTLRREMLRAMSAPWTAGDVAFTFGMWLIMMIGMMTPSAAPMLLLFAATQRQQGAPRLPLAVLAFGAGYSAVWTVFSVLATLAQWALQRTAMLAPEMTTIDPRLSGAILLAAGLYQLTPLKRTCLGKCQTPVGFLMTHWRDGTRGALRMGIDHGVFCLGCCWALMCVLFVVGAMNLAWVAALTLLVLLEKVGPGGRYIAGATGVVMIAAGVTLLLSGHPT